MNLSLLVLLQILIFLFPQAGHSDSIISLLFFVLNIFGSIFPVYCFNYFILVTGTIFSKSSVLLSITLLIPLFSVFSLRNSNTYKLISPKNVKTSKLGSFGLHQKI